MTKSEIDNINSLRLKGWGYKRIASELGISANNVKSYIKRHPLADKSIRCCELCGKELNVASKCKVKRFCSDKCRMQWWKQHPEQMQHKTLYPHLCKYCGASFASPRKESKFCDMKCYTAFRRKESL